MRTNSQLIHYLNSRSVADRVGGVEYVEANGWGGGLLRPQLSALDVLYAALRSIEY
jgi:hypothetical protein